ncbi:hypothetical protein BASA60_007890 [Batrachochytrium salamandrivorans]|nr:hypothetical protein BASA60_007890 [Batrachochytrium salamandrivorans]
MTQGSPVSKPKPKMTQGSPVSKPKPKVTQGSPENEPKPTVTQIPPENEPKPTATQVPPENEPKPTATQVPPENEPKPTVAQVPPENEPKPTVTQDPPQNESESELSQDPPENDSSMSQDIEPTDKESFDDLDMNGADIDLICNTLMPIATSLHKSLLEYADEFHSNLSVLYSLQEKAENLKDEEKEEHSVSYRHITLRLEAIKVEFAGLKKKYAKLFKTLVDKKCMPEDYYLIAPVDMDRVGILLDELQVLPWNAKIHGDDVTSSAYAI